MKVKIKNHTLDLHYAHRIYIIFENIMKDTVQDIDPNSQTAQLALVYAALQTTLKYHKIDDVVLNYEEVEDIIDENGNMVFMAEFNKWFSECVEAETELIKKLSDGEDIQEDKKKLKR